MKSEVIPTEEMNLVREDEVDIAKIPEDDSDLEEICDILD